MAYFLCSSSFYLISSSMDSEISRFFQFVDQELCCSFLIMLIMLSFLILYFARLNIWCNCEICQTYMKSNWKNQFDNLCDWYTYLLQKSPTQTIHIHVLDNTITANPINVEYMLKSRFDNFPKGKAFSTILGDFLGRGIFNVDGDLWRFQRKMASLELGRMSIRLYAFKVVRQEIDQRLIPLLESVKEKEDVFIDLQDVFKRFSFDSICRFSFGLDPNCLELSLPISKFAVSFDLASKLSAERALSVSPLIWKIRRLLDIGDEKTLRKSINMINKLAQEVINQRRRFGFSNQDDLLSRFMGSVNDEIFLRDIVVSFLLAGRDTVASVLTGFFRLISTHQSVENKILDEADRVVGDKEITSYDQMKELHYLHAAIYESMRLYPPVQFDSKFCANNDVLPDGMTVKKGTRVTYHPYAMGRMEELWGKDCLDFKPERWLRDGVFFKEENPFKFPVFQAGIRVCLGKEMALLELKSVAFSLLKRFSFELAPPETTTPRFSPGLTATFHGGLKVVIRAQRGGDNLKNGGSAV